MGVIWVDVFSLCSYSFQPLPAPAPAPPLLLPLPRPPFPFPSRRGVARNKLRVFFYFGGFQLIGAYFYAFLVPTTEKGFISEGLNRIAPKYTHDYSSYSSSCLPILLSFTSSPPSPPPCTLLRIFLFLHLRILIFPTLPPPTKHLSNIYPNHTQRHLLKLYP